MRYWLKTAYFYTISVLNAAFKSNPFRILPQLNGKTVKQYQQIVVHINQLMNYFRGQQADVLSTECTGDTSEGIHNQQNHCALHKVQAFNVCKHL